MRRAVFSLAVIIALACASDYLCAQSSPENQHPLDRPGTWDLSLWATEAVGNSAYGNVGDAYVSMAGFRTGYVLASHFENGPIRGTLEYFFDVIPVFLLTKPQVTYGVGLSPVGLKWNFSARHQPFLEVSGGGVLSTRDVPSGRTSNLNFTVAADGGMTVSHRTNADLTASVGFWHLSNAHMGLTNPSLNALQFGVAYHWYRHR
jgi:lipid A 3-O-deacylase PagL